MKMLSLPSKTKSIVLTTCLAMTLFFSTSCNHHENVKIPGMTGPTVNIQEDLIVVTFIYQKFTVPSEARFQIPNYDHSFVTISPNGENGGTILEFTIAIEDILNGDLDTQDPQRLPGGRPLPGVASGELPAVAFTLSDQFFDITLYLGNNVYGVFVPIELPFDDTIPTFRFEIEGKRLGNISLVGKDENGENSGVLLMLDLAANTKRMLRRIARRYAD